MAIKIEMLRCFVTVAKFGSLSDAAVALGRTSSAVSMMLRQFEDHVGSPLFETARKSRLTPIGEAIFDEACSGVNHFDSTRSTIESLAQSELGSLRVAVTPSVATTLLPSVILQFIQKYPNVHLDMRDMDSASIARELTRGRADIGIGTLGAMEGMTRTNLFSDAFGVVCRKEHPLAMEWNRLTWKDMRNQVFFANGLCDQIEDPDFVSILANSRLMVPNTASLLALIRQSDGITVLPHLAVPKSQDDIVFLPLTDAKARRRVQLLSRPSNMLMPVGREFVKLVLSRVRKNAEISKNEIQKI